MSQNQLHGTEGDSHSNNFPSDFGNVSPCMEDGNAPQPQLVDSREEGAAPSSAVVPSTAAVGNANTNNNAAANGGGATVDTMDLLALPDGPIGVDHVNWLLSACGISQERAIDSLRQCSSSLFALLFQRIFNCTIENLELEPNTQEKRLHNIQRVLEELQMFVSTDLSYISAKHIVALHEGHISELIRVFFEIVIGFVVNGQPMTANAHPNPNANANNSASNNVNASALAGHLLPDDDVSQADSAHKTQKLVSSWKAEVVHPLRDVGGNLIHSSANSTTASGSVHRRRQQPLSAAVGELHARLRHVDHMLVSPEKQHQMRGGPRAGTSGKVMGGNKKEAGATAHSGVGGGGILKKKAQPRSASASHHLLAPKGTRSSSSRFADPSKGVLSADAMAPSSGASSSLFPPSTYSLARTINTEARDMKIQQLKTMQFINTIQQKMRADIVRDASIKQRDIAGTIKGQQAVVRRDARDMMQYARDENERYKKAYECVLMSARNDVSRCRDLVDPKTVQLYERNAKAVRAASVGVKAAIQQQRDHEDRRVERYYDAITTWRRGTLACM